MSVTINADTSDGLKFTSDTSGEIKLQSAGADIATVSSTGIAMASGKSVSGGEIIQNSGPAFSAYNSSATSLTIYTATKVAFQTEEYDTANAFDSSTNYRFTPQVAGYYIVSGAFRIGTTSTELVLWLYKNGSAYKELAYLPATAGSTAVSGAAQVYLNGSTDYIELYAQQNAATQNTVTGSATTYFQASMVRGA